MKKPSSDRGFVMAAILFFITATAVILATVLPAYVMDSRRDQEDELIFRGAEYARAIKKFQTKYGTLPLTTDELIKGSDGIPSLRRLYVDPINGGEFRPIYVNADGTLQGSNLYLTLRDARTNTDPSAANVADVLADDAAANPNAAGGAAPAAGAGNTGNGAGAANLNNQGTSLAGNTGTNLQTNQGANLTNNRGTNLNTVGTGTGAAAAPAAPAAAAPATTTTQQAGLVGVGSQADIGRDAVKKYVGQVRYVNWEFISNVSRTGRGAANANATGTTNTTGATGTAGTGATGATGTNLTNNTGTNLTTGAGATGGTAARGGTTGGTTGGATGGARGGH